MCLCTGNILFTRCKAHCCINYGVEVTKPSNPWVLWHKKKKKKRSWVWNLRRKKASVHIRDAKCRLKCWELGQAHREHTRQSPSASHLKASPPQIMHNIISCLPWWQGSLIFWRKHHWKNVWFLLRVIKPLKGWPQRTESLTNVMADEQPNSSLAESD